MFFGILRLQPIYITYCLIFFLQIIVYVERYIYYGKIDRHQILFLILGLTTMFIYICTLLYEQWYYFLYLYSSPALTPTPLELAPVRAACNTYRQC